MSSEKEKPNTPYSSSSSGADIPTPTHSDPPSPKIPSARFQHSAPPTQDHQQTLILISAIYPLTVLVGCLFSLISPTGHQASYFSRKNNIFNILFVKVGWLWTTLAFSVLVYSIRHPNGPEARIKAIFRWVQATIGWILVTQWFFGPPLMDRTFTWTGGACRPDQNGIYTSEGYSDKKSAQTIEAFTSVACKMAGGRWSGGHDLSGHTFMLTHASLFLWAEMLPRILDGKRRVMSGTREYKGVHWFVWAVLGLWWWMLLMTSIYFHTFQEKVTGLIVSLLQWGLVYIYAIPQFEAAREILGVPVA